METGYGKSLRLGASQRPDGNESGQLYLPRLTLVGGWVPKLFALAASKRAFFSYSQFYNSHAINLCKVEML